MSTDYEVRAAEILKNLSLDQKLGQVSCYIAPTLTQISDIVERFPHGVGHISCLDVRSATTLDEVIEFQHTAQRLVMEQSGLGIPVTFHMEGVCGAFLPGATSFPNGMARGATWDPDREAAIGEAVGRQERALGITQTLAPVLDVARDPRMGRVGEAYSEDATLVAALGAAFARAVQGTDADGRTTDAVAKHFVGSHHVEGGIHGAAVEVSERRLQEVHVKPFQAAITVGGLNGIMPSYNLVGGEPASASSRLLTDLLRKEMGFDGLTVSDYSAIMNLHCVQKVAESAAAAGVAALSAGLDVELPAPYAYAGELREWFMSGRADIAILDRAVTRVLVSKMRMGLFDAPFAASGDELVERYVRDGDADVAFGAARDSLVLLKNDGDVLPVSPGVRRIAVIGPHAASARFFFGGYTHYSMSEAMLASSSSMAGVDGTGGPRGLVDTIPGTSVERSDSPAYEELLTQQKPGIATLVSHLRERMPGVEVEWAQGFYAAGADESGHDKALALAASADLVIVTLGGKHGTASISTTGEGIDTTDINLPAGQESFLEKLGQLGVATVGIHLDGRPLSSDAADSHLDALIEAWSPAEHGARAIVDTLVGDHNPCGKLPVTVARHVGQVPIYYCHPHGSSWHQGGSIGFADYVDMPHTPRYPFGHGLSYTTFEYGTLGLSAVEVEPDETVTVSIDITNTGDRFGVEVVQFYASDRYASVARPVLELVGFRRVALEPGHTATVSFTLDPRQLAFLDQSMQWRVEAGAVDLMCAPSSAAATTMATVTITRDALVDPATRPFWAPSVIE